jgi:hypothetical protein
MLALSPCRSWACGKTPANSGHHDHSAGLGVQPALERSIDRPDQQTKTNRVSETTLTDPANPMGEFTRVDIVDEMKTAISITR